ncbi:MAG: isochorismatase family protein [Bacteroidota bacterium]
MEGRQGLLVIDMQKGSFTATTPRYDTEGVVRRINELAAIVRQRELPVFYIQHDGTGTGDFEKNARDWEILDELIVREEDILIDKYANDCFYRSNLQAKLSEAAIDELVITGCATDFCVESTIQSALSKDYTITVVEDGHTTADRPHMNTRQVIEHYNWVWQNMIPTNGSIMVKNCEHIKSSLS